MSVHDFASDADATHNEAAWKGWLNATFAA
jgi:hypothetical protein